MSVIKQGYDGKPTHIKIYARESRNAEVWIEQYGVIDESNPRRPQETLAYASLDELLDLRDEINAVIQVLISGKPKPGHTYE